MNTSSFRRFSNEEALEWGRKHYSDWMVNIQNKDNKPATPLEKFFRYYTQGAHVRFNSTTRLDNYLTCDFTDSFFSRQMFIDSIAEIKNHKLSENIVVYRYIPRTLIKAMLKNGGLSGSGKRTTLCQLVRTLPVYYLCSPRNTLRICWPDFRHAGKGNAICTGYETSSDKLFYI